MLEAHPISELFPRLDEEGLDRLAADIGRNGLLQPITLYEGMVLDGRNRLEACRRAGVEPDVVEYEGDSPVGYVISLNLERRHLTSSQRATLAVRILPMLEAEAHERQIATLRQGVELPVSQFIDTRDQGRATEIASQIVGTNPHYVFDAKKLQDEAPAMFEAVESGAISLPAVVRAVGNEAREAHRVAQSVAAPERPEIAVADYGDWLSQRGPCDLLLTDPPYSTDVADIAAFADEWLPLALAKVKRAGRAYVFIGAYPIELAAYSQRRAK